MQTADPNNFSNLPKQLNTGGKFVSNKEDLPPSDEMQDHYMKLLQKQTVCNSFNNEKIKLTNIKCISSEMIKCSNNTNNTILSKIAKLFNLTLDSGYYPETWNHGLIHSLHKNGSKMDSSNYRRITLLSSLVKLFSSLIYNHIENEIESKDIL